MPFDVVLIWLRCIVEFTFPFNFAADDVLATIERASTLTSPAWTTIAGYTPPMGWTNAAGFEIEMQATNMMRLKQLAPPADISAQFLRLRIGLQGN